MEQSIFDVGDVIDGRYRIEEFIGAGSRSEVFRAVRTDTSQQVALKVLHGHLSQSPEIRARFQREIRALAALGHPNVLTVYGAGRTRGHDYMVVELKDTAKLSTLLEETGPMQWIDAAEVVRQVCAGIAAAHAAGIAHRDLRPENMFVSRVSDRRFHITLAGFALARMAGHRITTTEEGTPIGSPDYLPPELADSSYTLGNDPIRLARADVYAIGCLAFALLHGYPPLVAERALETLMKRLLTEDADWSPRVADAIPKTFRGLVDAMLSQRPADRPTAEALLKDLEDILRSAPRTPARRAGGVTEEWDSSPLLKPRKDP